uniref:PH domain-containing protein n=1 Tax=Globisporangium ultimum (strain ATCC 200006 / CBS 805.95 / DAOM BR144) TaxID=431595 RepID=K3X6P8_GLOUD
MEAQHSGWVFKQGSLVRNWKKRFMVLRGKQLTYYDTASISPKTKEKGSFQVITAELSSDIQNGLLVHGKGGRVLKLYTDSAESSRAWYTSILEATTGMMIGGSRMSLTSDGRYSVLSAANSNNSSSVDVDEELELLDRLDSLPLDDAGSIHHSGWLKKEGSRIKNWKKRYFTLHGNTLSYYDSADTGSAAKGYGHVKSVEVNGERENSLDITFERGRLLRVSAKNQDDMEQWLCILSEAIEQKNAEDNNIRQSIASRGSFRMSMSVAVAKPPRVSSMPMRHSISSAPAPSTPSKQPQNFGGSVPAAYSSVLEKRTSSNDSYATTTAQSYADEYAIETDSDEYESDDSEGDWI